MNTQLLCIYHGNCADGFAAAWVVRKYYKEHLKMFDDGMTDLPEFYPGVYQQDPPDCTGRDVIIVDFSYKRPVMERILEQCKSLTWIDHHKSAIHDMHEVCAKYDTPPYQGSNNKFKFRVTVERSGSMLTWNYYFPNQEPPQLLKHIEDRDLWKFDIPGTREIQANLFSYPYDFEVWDKIFAESQADLCARLYKDGFAIERKHFKDIHELLNVVTRWMRIGGVEMPVANLPYTFSSDAGHILSENAINKCAACYWDTPDGRVFSLRSLDDGPDVSEIAKQYGGGGHLHAAGFTVSPTVAKTFEKEDMYKSDYQLFRENV